MTATRSTRPPETEAGFMATVRQYATLRGWKVFHVYDSRRSAHGFPDLVLVRAGRLIFAELKSEKGKTTPAQDEWLDALAAVGQASRLVRTFLWRPSDFDEICEVLR